MPPAESLSALARSHFVVAETAKRMPVFGCKTVRRAVESTDAGIRLLRRIAISLQPITEVVGTFVLIRENPSESIRGIELEGVIEYGAVFCSWLFLPLKPFFANQFIALTRSPANVLLNVTQT